MHQNSQGKGNWKAKGSRRIRHFIMMVPALVLILGMAFPKMAFADTLQKLDKPTADTSRYTYNGQTQTYSPDGFEADKMVMENGTQKDAGSYIVKVTPAEGYEWQDGNTDDVEFTWVIDAAKLAKPEAGTTELKANGQEQTYTPAGFDAATMIIEGNKKTDAGSYTAKVSLKDKANYTWADGSTNDIEFEWTMIPDPNAPVPTGDQSAFMLWIALLLISGGVLAGMMAYKRRVE